jgi:copper homeostasis protein
MNTVLFELCVESLQAAHAAERGGADRVELCARLEISGVTPSQTLIAAVVQALSIPVHILIRPRGGDFAYTASEFAQMRQQVQWVKASGAAGVVLGVLLAGGRIDVSRSRELVELARPLKVTFNRAFDEAHDLSNALEEIIATGSDCLLTSGGAADVHTGAAQIAQLLRQAGDRVEIMAGGGLKLASIAELLERTGVRCLHGSLTRKASDCGHQSTNGHSAGGNAETLEADVRAAVELLHRHFAVNKNKISASTR